MSNAADMSTPVTRGELQEELTKFRQEMHQAIAPLATKAELEIWGGALLARIQSSEHTLRQEMRELVTASENSVKAFVETTVQTAIQATEKRLQAELAHHAAALFESMSALITAHDDKYADLPGRVKRLETRVFRTKPR